jgi:two-component system, OmpR family, alkaline phosphatase synthesis response regulator PhoP
MSRILLVEDREEMAEAVRYNLDLEGHEVDVALDGRSGLEAGLSGKYDLVILDLMLPELDGYAVLERLRAAHVDIPILVLTARGEEADKVRGFRAGADQYLVKPFGLMELIERVRLLLRRWGREPASSAAPIRLRDIEIDVASRVVRRGGVPVHLSPKAFDLLVALVRRRGAVATRLELMQEVWGYRAAVLSRTVDAHVAEIRRVLETESAAPKIVVTVRKRGYRIDVNTA